jgi:TatD DNase family protein
MTMSKKGLATIARIPPDRILTESDGPFVTIGSRTVVPADVQVVEQKVAEMWHTDSATVRTTVAENFRRLLGPIRSDQQPWSV